MDFAVVAEGVARRYGRRWALAGVTFRIPPGSVAMLSGRNGSGKSTLLRVLATAIRPDQGRAVVGGFDVVRDREDVRRQTALLSHYTYLYESLSARENLTVAARVIGSTSWNGLLDEVGLANRADDPVSTYSAGMRKRLSFARVLLQDPKIVFLDEPYGQLDPEGFALVEGVVRRFRERGATVIIATHQVERVASYADMQIHLEGGRVVESGR